MNNDVSSNNYIFVSTDTESVEGAPVSAHELVSFRLKHNLWPLYEKTRNRLSMRPGDNLLFYCGGNMKNSKRIIASAKIEKINISRNMAGFQEGKEFFTQTPHQLVKLEDIAVWKNPVILREILPQLECCPKNMSKWGVILHGGVRRISDADYNTIQEFSHKIKN